LERFIEEERIMGIEILDAKECLPKSILNKLKESI
jgi:uncharacterized protein YuzE